MIARDGEDRTFVKCIGLIELAVILRNLSVEVYTVPSYVQKGWVFALRGIGVEVLLHALRDEFLRNGIVDAAHVAVDVADELLRLDDGFILVVGENVLEIEMKGFIPGGRGQGTEMRVPRLLHGDREA